jgi:hypothetical protein
VLGVALRFLQTGKTEITRGFEEDEKGYEVKAEENFVLTGGYSRKILNRLQIGITYSLINIKLIEKISRTTTALDLGILYPDLGIRNFTLGFTVQNIGLSFFSKNDNQLSLIAFHRKITFDEEGDYLPLGFRLGISYKMAMFPQFPDLYYLVGADLVKYLGSPYRTHLGLEQWYKGIFALRIGYKIGYDLATLTGGIGIAWNRYKFDYGFTLYGRGMRDDHLISLGVGF